MPPYPENKLMEMNWADASTIIRKADGSDNWPLAWGGDGRLYTAYGDGRGFRPKVKEKLSLGFAVIEGSPKNFRGKNILSPDVQYGDGPSGKKASGLLMVDGMLYMWARNADGNGKHSQLAWSSDNGSTWQWANWRFTEFGYPTFIDYGRNYSGARDNYVYVVSHDNPSAYESADRFILMRVPKDEIGKRDSYEFFCKVDKSGSPVWSDRIAQRGAVFKDPGLCFRSGITYNPVLERYFWWQGKFDSGEDGRYAGAFGIFASSEPWGPWTTVYYTNDWDVGVGETASFPPKWMSRDGKTMYLVFSGDDAFSVRKCTLTLKPEKSVIR